MCSHTIHTDVNVCVCVCVRFHSFLLFLGQPSSSIRDIKVTSFCRIISEFALEYRTTRERVLTLKRKRATHRERTKTRGKMITEVTTPLTLTHTGRSEVTTQQTLRAAPFFSGYWCLTPTQQFFILLLIFVFLLFLLLFLLDGEVLGGGASSGQSLPCLHVDGGGVSSGGGA